jgi:hypothetical protein
MYLFIFKKLKIIILTFNFFEKKILDVANDGIYKHVKYQCEIISTLGYTKITTVWI